MELATIDEVESKLKLGSNEVISLFIQERINILKESEELVQRCTFEEAERLFFSMKDLLSRNSANIRKTTHSFMHNLLACHPKLIERNGNKIFKTINASNSSSEAKLNVISLNLQTFQSYIEKHIEYVACSKGLILLMCYFIESLPFQRLVEVLNFLGILQSKRHKQSKSQTKGRTYNNE